MNVLVIGQNGREHALAVSYAKSKSVKKVIMTPGNGLTDFNSPKIKNYSTVAMMDFEAIIKVCKIEGIDLVDVGQDDIIAAGYVDKFERIGITAFGPTQKASQLEWDKKWARNFMVKYSLPIPKFKAFSSQKEAIDYVNKQADRLLFVKATGLAFGKGVIKATNKAEAIFAIEQMKNFGKSGGIFLIEEGLIGEEFSLFALCDGKNYQIISWAQDHKTIYDKDKGPNTGGVGSVAPAGVVTKKILKEVDRNILFPLMKGMQKEGRPYKGILYLGGMISKSGVKVIEFNARWGDPEAEVILPSIKTDYLKIAQSILSGKLRTLKIKIDNKVRVSVAGCSKGYPGDYSKVKDKEIIGLNKAMKLPGITVFGSSIERKGERFFVNGGRVFYIVGEGKNILDARKKAYRAMNLISIEGNNLHYRTDIGFRDVERMSSLRKQGSNYCIDSGSSSHR
ncbi:phosphoribosylamine--glycine ligase [Candidatus Daviesbacteria bacterium RIFCSPHIGHO2_02_FULL_39_12]|uniref:Phosphoribosylamine--glycine ligase n=2 Tax=Candidatus Daviesiibacteriota TaxID=1752718 RepID=A0A1F5JDS7_9BACT|nr:MAG: phosphoribosylamine--glycine ligase [Candidatus Daviesbacteria bacterium RIFCSPHIGHO2_02_FULL_39_12]OGE71914.1 MAG: phosphoribosylamine--glycine ligase [Candidatus Daviesbacteria bacterium RIFCSPLOWO2_02_FULL_38_15]